MFDSNAPTDMMTVTNMARVMSTSTRVMPRVDADIADIVARVSYGPNETVFCCQPLPTVTLPE